jgi:hypothetical protein
VFTRIGLAALTTLAVLGGAYGQEMPMPAPVNGAVPKNVAAPAMQTFGCPTCEQPCTDCGDCACQQGHVWADADALWWWLRKTHLPPLVTTSPPGTPEGSAGILGASTIVLGNDGVNGGARFGGRLDLGYWFDDDQRDGFEVTSFVLAGETKNLAVSSNGDTILSRPFFDALFNRPDRVEVAFPGATAGSVQVGSTSGTLLGADALFRENVARGRGYWLDVIVGYRYLHYSDSLGVSVNSSSIDPAEPTTVGASFDSFRASNDFHGFEWGVTGGLRSGSWGLDGLAKLAVGYNNELTEINGSTTITTGGVPASFAGGFLALASNIGSHNTGQWDAIPEFGLRLTYQLSQHMTAHAGYTLLYWSGMTRAADQANLLINQDFIPPSTAGGRPAAPFFSFQSQQIWAQGVDLGVEIRF